MFPLLAVVGALASSPAYPSPCDVAFSPDGSVVAVADHGRSRVVLLAAADGSARGEIPLVKPTALAWSGDRLYAAENGALTVAELDPARAKLLRRLPVAPRPAGVAVAPRRRLLAATGSATGELTIVDLATGRPARRVPLAGEPFAVAITPDETTAVVTQLVPVGDATRDDHAAAVFLVDLLGARPPEAIPLVAGATAVREVAIAPDGRWAYLAHCIGRYQLPTTQLDRGWVNTNAVTILDLAARTRYATVLLDQLHEGAADPWGLALSPDGRTLQVTCSGVHQLARLNLARLHDYLEGRLPTDSPLLQTSAEYALTALNLWPRIAADPTARSLLADDLVALTRAELLDRRPLAIRGPRGLDIAPDGRLAVAGYFSGAVAIDQAVYPLGPSRPPDAVRRGEAHFHDATLAFQHWLSCATCHPDARADGLNWDLLNDGIGNPKNTKSMLLADRTPPAMAHGIRADVTHAAAAGFRFIGRAATDDELADILAYLRSLTPRASPHRGPAAQRGAAIYHNPRVGCAKCHPAPLYTDLQAYDVGTATTLDSAPEFDTPTLVEAWRTAPYLHDGRAASLRDVLTAANPHDRHGATAHLGPRELDDLVAFVLSL